MSKFAVIPWSELYYNDKMFDTNPPYNRDYLVEPYVEMREEFERLGHEIHTVDLYEDYDEVNFFLFFSLEWNYYHDLVKRNMAYKMVYCMAEPPSACPYNTSRGYNILKHVFPYIMTWNDDWVDNRSIFKRNIPCWLVDQREGSLTFGEKKLLTCISGNKNSDYPGELYSERVRAIEYFESNHPDDFDLYGTGWDADKHICYKGKAVNKADTYHGYRFALCYENIEGLKGYITEKILDCIGSGIVPIYAGSIDIEDCVPEDCFIRLRDYRDYNALYEYISNVDEETYEKFLKCSDEYLKSPISDYFSGSGYTHYLLKAVSREKKDFRSSKIAYRVFKYVYYRKG